MALGVGAPPVAEGVTGAVAAGVGAAGVLPLPAAAGGEVAAAASAEGVAALGVEALGAGVEAAGLEDWDPPSSRFMTDWPPAAASKRARCAKWEAFSGGCLVS